MVDGLLQLVTGKRMSNDSVELVLNTWHREKPFSWIAEQGFQLNWWNHLDFGSPRKSTSLITNRLPPE